MTSSHLALDYWAEALNVLTSSHLASDHWDQALNVLTSSHLASDHWAAQIRSVESLHNRPSLTRHPTKCHTPRSWNWQPSAARTEYCPPNKPRSQSPAESSFDQPAGQALGFLDVEQKPWFSLHALPPEKRPGTTRGSGPNRPGWVRRKPSSHQKRGST